MSDYKLTEDMEPLPFLDFSKGKHDPNDPNDPVFVAMGWFDRNLLAKGRPLTEEDLRLLGYFRDSLIKHLPP